MVQWGWDACRIWHIDRASGASDELAGGGSKNPLTGSKRYLYGSKWSLSDWRSRTWPDCRASLFLFPGWHGRTAGGAWAKSRKLSGGSCKNDRIPFYKRRSWACGFPHGSGTSSAWNRREKATFPFSYAKRGAAGGTWQSADRKTNLSNRRPCGNKKGGFYYSGRDRP